MVVPNVRISGPLVDYLPGLWSDLRSQGYTSLSGRNLLRLTSHMSRWLEESGLQACDLTDERADAFLAARRKEGYVAFLNRRGLAPIRRYLLAAGVTPVATDAVVVEPTPVQKLVAGYEEYLVHERALSPSCVQSYAAVAERFLVEHHPKCGDMDLTSLGGQEVLQFVLGTSRGWSLNQTRSMLTGLRSFLRFIYVRGDIATDLTGAVPAVAGWRLAALPKYLPPQQVSAILESCDRRTSMGRRDYAVLLLLARLGLRAGEVAALSLDDVDWREGVLIIRGKGGRQDRLPLPVEVGRAMAAYLHRGRRRTTSRSMFLGARAPFAKLDRSAVTAIVGRACQHADLPIVGAHRLRHTSATVMLRKGASLGEISQVLRHQHFATTAIYAKVDHRRLRELAQSWPGGAA